MSAKYIFLFRVTLFETLLLEMLYLPHALEIPNWVWWFMLGYAGFATLLWWGERTKQVSQTGSLWTFMVDIGITSIVLIHCQGYANDFYIAYFMVILGSCFMENLMFSFLVGALACVVYGALTFPGPEAWQEPSYLLRLSLLLVMSFFSTAMADQARRIHREEEDRFNKQAAWLERLSTVGRAISAVLHEIKTPLSTISLASEQLQEQLAQGKEIGKYVELIQEEADRSQDILLRYLDFVRPSELDLRARDLVPIVQKTLALTQLSFNAAQVRISSYFACQPQVYADERYLVQALTNLLNNALKASGPGGGVSIRVNASSHTVRITIEDSGPGVSTEMKDHLFEPFATERSADGGHGLGLSVSKWIALHHRGDLQISNRIPGPGACAELTLPLRIPSE